MTDSSRRAATEGDLLLLAQAFLEERITYERFRRLLLDTWSDLKRGALSAEDRRTWAEIVGAARQTTPEVLQAAERGALFDHDFFRDSLFLWLFEDRGGERVARTRRARRIRDSISRVLLEEWDPIGVADVPEAADEYAAYVGEMYRLIAQSADAETIAARLAAIEVTEMGLRPVDPAALLPVAGSLLALDIGLSRRVSSDSEGAG